MNLIPTKLFKNKFQKNIATLFSGTVISQSINVIGALFLANLYGKDLYGVYSSFLSIVGILTVVNSLKLEYIIITDKDLKKSENIAKGLFYLILIICTIHILFFWLTKSLFDSKGIIYIVLLASSLTSFFLSNSKALESLATRTSRFKLIANARILMSISIVLIQFLLFYYQKHGLIYGYGLAMLIVFGYYVITIKNGFKKPNIQLFNSTVKSHQNILKFAFPSGMVNIIAINIMPILLLSYFSAATAGIYALSLKVVSVPLFIVSASVSQVYFQKASDYFNHEKEKLYNLTFKVAMTNIVIMLGILILINTLGIYLLELIFDNNWDNLREYIFILSFLVLGQVGFSPISSLIVIINKMQVGLIFNIYLVCVNIIAIYVGHLFGNIRYTILILSIAGGLGYLILLLYFLMILKDFRNESNPN